MRCSSYCTADSFTLENKLEEIQNLGYQVEFIEKVIHAKRQSKTDEGGECDIFIFHFGCIIIWGASEQEELDIIDDFSFLELESVSEIHSEFNSFEYDPEKRRTYIDEEKNIIYIADDSKLIKLSISHALAQTVKLNELEKFIRSLLEQTKPIQKELANNGSVRLSKSEISKQIGILFNARYSVNMHSDILDTPEFFWRRPSYEPMYLMTVEYHDIRVRQGILNNHLDLIHELYSMLSSDLNHKHSTRLEVVIIILIAIEVFLALFNENLFGKIIAPFL